MKIKSFIYASALSLGCFAMVGCADLDPVDFSEINPSVFPKTEQDIESLVNDCYYPIRSSWFDGLFSFDERGVVAINDATTEILTNRAGMFKNQHDLNWNATTDYLTGFYYTAKDPSGGGFRDGYNNDISRCTSVLTQIEQATFLDANRQKGFEAEVRCARAFIAYTLYDMFGPLVVAPADVLANPMKDSPLPRLTTEEMVKFIEDDLTFAADNLPAPAQAEYGKFSSGLANMLLIRLYLHESRADKSYYNKVETLARKLMSPEFGYALQPSYPKMFEVGGQGKANKEIIFALPVNFEMVSWNNWHMFVLPSNFKKEGMKGGYESLKSTWYFYDSFEDGDERRTYLIPEYTDLKADTLCSRGEYPHLDIGPVAMKMGYDPDIYSHNSRSSIDPIIYRFADVYLSLAEALYRKPGATAADKAEALRLINTIRQRAKVGELTMDDIDNDDKFIDHLLAERSHEFWCENGQYRADLIRLDRFLDHAKRINGSPYATKGKELYPLPLIVITDGKGVVKQNPEYD